MIDLAAATQQLDAMLAKYGLAWSHCIRVEVWHHKTSPHPDVSFTASAIGDDLRCIMEGGRTLESALDGLDRLLADHVRPASVLEEFQVEVPEVVPETEPIPAA